MAAGLAAGIGHARLQAFLVATKATAVEQVQRTWTCAGQIAVSAFIRGGLVVETRATEESLAALAGQDAKVDATGRLAADRAVVDHVACSQLTRVDLHVHSEG